jgi:hypothetical protein
MHRFSRPLAAAALAALLVPGLAAGQDHRFGAGFNTGGIYFTQLNPSPGSINGAAGRDLTMDPSWVVGLQFERWYGSGRLGARLNGAFTQSGMEVPGRSPRDIGYWLADASLLLRFLAAEPDRGVAPFLSAGVGVVKYKLGDGDVLQYTPSASVFDGDDSPRLAVAGGIGFDIRTGWNWDDEPVWVRLEGTDHIALKSPLRELATGDRYGLIHSFRVTLGVFTGFGVL